MIDGVEALISAEQQLEKGVDLKTAMGKHADILAETTEGFPKWTTHKCLVRKVMDEPMYNRLSKLKTSKGFTLDFAIKAGVILPHVGVGITNDGVESLNLFKEL
jgi:hypothetical protein